MCVCVICQQHDFITHSGCHEKYTCYIDAVYIYINTLFNMAVLYYVELRCIFSLWIFTQNVYILTNMVLSFFDDRLYLNVNMLKRQWQLNEKGLGLHERNLRGKCASAIRAANKVVNKLIPLLKSDNSDLEPVK